MVSVYMCPVPWSQFELGFETLAFLLFIYQKYYTILYSVIFYLNYRSTNGLNSDPNEALLNPRESRQQENTLLSPQYRSMSPDLGFHWANVTESSEDLNLSRIKEEISGNYYLKYTDLLSSFPPSSNDYSNFKIEPRNQESNDIGKRLLLKSLSQGDFYADSRSNGAINCGRGISQIFPSTNVSNLDLTWLTNPRSLDMNLQALDLLNSSRFSGNFNLSFPNQIGLLRDGLCYGIDYLHQSHQAPILYNSNKVGIYIHLSFHCFSHKSSLHC